jgi:hypothetical protein
MRILNAIVVGLLFISANLVGMAAVAAPNIDGMSIQIGDTLPKVQQVYSTTLKPQPTDSATNPGASVLRLADLGVWFFFDMNGKIYTIRFDAPFGGAINGLKIGDTSAKMQQALGQPLNVLNQSQAGVSPSYIYHLDDQTTARFDLDPNQNIKTVFLLNSGAH